MSRGMTACAVLGAALALVPAAAASGGGEGPMAPTVLRTFDVVTRFVDRDALRPDGFDCRPSLLKPGTFTETCKVHLVGQAFLTGTIAGTAELNYEVWPVPPKLRYTGVVPFEGTIEGCGTGGFVMEFPSGSVDYDQFSAADASAPGWNSWVVRRGSGTGGLEGLVSGGGDVRFRAYALRGHEATRDVFKGNFAEGTFDGQVTCAVARGGPAEATSHRRASGRRAPGGRR